MMSISLVTIAKDDKWRWGEQPAKNHNRIESRFSAHQHHCGSLCGSLRLGVCQRKWPQSECGEVWRYENGE